MRSVDKFVTMARLMPVLNHFHRGCALLQPKVAQSPDYAYLCSAFPIAAVSKDGVPNQGGYVCNVNFLNFVVGTLLNAVRLRNRHEAYHPSFSPPIVRQFPNVYTVVHQFHGLRVPKTQKGPVTPKSSRATRCLDLFLFLELPKRIQDCLRCAFNGCPCMWRNFQWA